QFGDCKDKASLFSTLLRSQHIDAHLVLVPRFTQAHEAMPGLAFNHAISRVTLGNETVWVDTTDDVCRFGMLPPGDPGRKVLVINGQKGGLVQLPAPEPGAQRLQISGEIGWLDGSEALPADVQAVASGYPDYQLRASARDAR